MKKKLLILCSVMFCLILFGKTDVSAKSAKPKWLQIGKTYTYDLDKDGAKEKLLCNFTGSGYNKQLTINGKKVFSTKSQYAEIAVADMDQSDKQMEIFIASGKGLEDIFSSVNLKYYTFKNGKFAKVQDIKSVIKQKYSSVKYISVAGEETAYFPVKNGKLSVGVNLNLKNGLGIKSIYDTVVFKKGKFVTSTNKSFSIEEYGTKYKCKGTNKVYKSPGSKKVAFKLKNKEKYSVIGFYWKNKNTYYIKVKNSKGKKGYVKNGTFKTYAKAYF